MQFNFSYNFNLLDNLIVLVILILFFGLTYLIIKFIKSHVAERKRNSDKMFITEEYLPSEELQSIRQMFYLAMNLMKILTQHIIHISLKENIN